MLTREELEELVTDGIDRETSEMLKLTEGGKHHGRETESVEELGIVDEHCGSCGVSGKDILPH